MLSSFFSDASEARLVDRTARHVFSNPALVPFDDNFYDSYGASQFIEHLFAKLQGNGEKSSDDREVGMGMLATALENETRVAAEVLKDGRLKSFLERIPYIVDSISEQEEADQLLRVWTLLLYRDAAIGTNLSKVIPRLMGKLSGYISASVSSGIVERDRVKEPLCIAMLSAVAGCQYQNTLMPHADSLVASCLMLRDWDEEKGLQSLFALVMSLESPLTWQGVWSLLTDSACDLCRNHLGIPVTPRPVSQSAKKTNDADDSTLKSRGSGVGVYKTVENTLQVTLERLSQVMRRGDTAHFAGMVFDATEEVAPKGKPSSKSKQSKGKGGHQNGCVGAIAAETVYRRLLGTLRAMLEVGCATGAIQLDLLALLPLHRAVLGINSVSSAHKSGNGGVDPKALLLPGASGLSPADLMLVAPALKVRTLQLIQSLLALRSPALLKAGAELSEPVAHLFVDVETHRHPLVGEAATLTIASIAESFPTILARHLSGAMEVLAGLYAAEVEQLTREPSIAVAAQPVSASSAKAKKISDAAPSPSNATLPFSTGALHTAEVGSSGPSSSLSTTRAGELAIAITPGLYRSDGLTGMRSHSATAPGALAVFTAVETVLLYCAAFLSEKLQDRFEYFTGQALHCLTKGLMACTVPNKAVKRARVAPLRMSADLQRAVLRIARADLAYPRSTGMRSGNAALLLAVCEATKHQTSTAAESVTCQVLLEALLNPASAPLVSPNYDDIAARKARRALEQQEEEEQLARTHADQLRRAARKRDAAEESAPSGSEGPEGPEGRGGSAKRARGADNRSKGEPDEPEEGDKGEDEEEDKDEDEDEDEDDDGDEQEKRQESAEHLALRNDDDDDDDFELPEIV